MLVQILILVVGLVILIGGADLLVRGAAGIARALGISELVIGLTVVAFGTSAPELAVNVTGAVTGNSEISFGNIVGSNIANVGLILAVAALIRPLAIHMGVILREIPMMVLATFATVALILDGPLDGAPAAISRTDAVALLLIFCVFLYYTVHEALLQRQAARLDDEAPESTGQPAVDAVFLVLGLVGLVLGGRFTVDAASELALAIGVPQVFVGLTVVAVGTSLPELATSGVAAWRGQTDIAVGNVVGSNIFNLLFVLGVSATIRPIPLPDGGLLDLIVMSMLALILLPLSLTHRFRIVRWEGLLLLTLYFSYVAGRQFLVNG